MARSAVRRIEEPPRRKIMDVIIFAGIAVTLLFALVGLVSAGMFVGGKLSGGTKTHHTANSTKTRTSGSQEVAAAQVQATQIVRAARAAEHAIVVSATTRANRRAKAIMKSAQQEAARTRAAAARAAAASAASNNASTSTGSSTTSTAPAASSGTTSSSPASGSETTTGVASSSTGATTTGSVSSSTGVSSTYPSSEAQTSVTPVPALSSAPANLTGLPASWKVVAYNTTFGSGSGSVGSITVTNRGARTYSGTAQVSYTGGGSASASFAGLAPGQTIVLPLNGSAYPGRGFHIQVLDVH